MRVLLVVLALAATASADLTRPAYLGFTEVGDGRFDVTWRVPRRGDRVLAIRAKLPDVFRRTTEPTVRLGSDVQTSTWTVEAKPWELPGAKIVVEGPGTARVDTMVRFQFRDGTVVARILPPGTTECAFPKRASARSAAREIQDETLTGGRYVLGTLVLLALVLALGLCGSARIVALAWGLFACGQLAGMAFDLRVPEAFAHSLLGVGAAVIAAGAQRPDARSIALVALACGVAHGAGMPGGPAGAIGADAIGLVLALAIVRVPGKRMLAYVVGTAGVALALVEATAPDLAAAATPRANVLLAPASGQADAPASARVAAASDAPLQVFVEVTPFETRVEWLARLSTLGVAEGKDVAVPDQDALKQRIRALFEDRLGIEIDNRAVTLAEARVDFVTREAGGVLERVEPVVESVEEAWVGVAHSCPTREPPSKLRVLWRPLPGMASVPAVVVDPRNTRVDELETELAWSDALTMPPIRAVAVRSRSVPVSLISVALLLVATLGGIRWFGRGGGIGARLLLAGACLATPYLQVAVPLPAEAAPSADEAGEIVEALVANIYRGLEQQDESAAYDRLRVSVTDAAVQPVYLEQRRMLELGRRGGARARVDSVEVVEVESIEPAADGGWRASVAWQAGGFVVHYGHRHFRQNRYEATVELVPEDGSWKLDRLAVLGKERLR